MLSDFEIRINMERVALFEKQDAFELLFKHFYERLKRFARSIVKTNEAAEDVVAEVFLVLWNNRARLLDIKNLNSYLYLITKNLAIRELSKTTSIRFFSVNDIELQLIPAIEKNPEESLLNNEMIRQYEKAVEQLPPRCKLIYLLVKQEQLRYKEIASILNISIKTIDAQMAIATRRITKAVRFEVTS